MKQKGFIGALFDMSFSYFVTTRIIRLLYALTILAAAIAAVVVLVAGVTMDGDEGERLVAIVGAPILFVVVVLLARVICEIYVVLFRIAENTAILAHHARGVTADANLVGAAAPAPAPAPAGDSAASAAPGPAPAPAPSPDSAASASSATAPAPAPDLVAAPAPHPGAEAASAAPGPESAAALPRPLVEGAAPKPEPEAELGAPGPGPEEPSWAPPGDKREMARRRLEADERLKPYATALLQSANTDAQYEWLTSTGAAEVLAWAQANLPRPPTVAS